MYYAMNSKVAAIHAVPGKALGIWAFVLAFVFPVLGLIFGVVASQQSRRAGVSNQLATAAIPISAVLIATGAILAIAL